MGITERIRAWLRREGEEASELLADAERRLDADVARRERELAATPEERVELLQDRIADNDAELEAIRERLRRSAADAPGDDGPVTS